MPEGVAEVPPSPDVQIREKCRAVLAAGYDFTECGGGMLAGLKAEQKYNLLNENAKDSLKILAVNSLFPSSFRLAVPSEDSEKYVEYAVRLFDIMRDLGAKYAVFGSGAARMIQAEYSTSFDILTKFISQIGTEAKSRGITLVIEPLRKCETNIFIDVPETGEFVKKLNHPGVKLLYDAFHMAEEGTDVSCVCKYADMVKHCHIAESPRRSYPGSPDSNDLTYNRSFARELIKSGYSGGVSVECGFTEFLRDIQTAHTYLKEIFNDKTGTV